MNDKLKGVLVPAATPFDEHGELSIAMLADNFSKWGATSVRGYMCLGSNGEFRSLSDDESLSVVREAIDLKQGKTLVVGAGRESARLTLAFLERIAALPAGVDYVSVLTPHYFARLMDDAALLDYYVGVADRSPLPVLVYVAPGFANGVTVSPGVLQELAAHPNIAGVKDTSPALMADYMLATGDRPDFTVLAGSLGNLMTCLVFGGAGGVVSAANYFPSQCARVTDLYFAGDHLASREHYTRLQLAVKATGARHGVASLKSCMNLCGFSGGWPRPPVKALSPRREAELRAALADSHVPD